MDQFIRYIDPALMVLIPVLYIAGFIIKNTRAVKDNYIPLLLGGLGILLAVLWVLATSDLASAQNVLLALFTAVVQGVLCAGCAVYADQLKKQASKDK